MCRSSDPMAHLHKGKLLPRTNWPDWSMWFGDEQRQPAYVECNWSAMGSAPISTYMRGTFMVPYIHPQGIQPGVIWYWYRQGTVAGYFLDVSMYTTLLDGVGQGRIEMYGSLDGTQYAYDRWDFTTYPASSNLTLHPGDRAASSRRDTSVWGDLFDLQLNSIIWAGIPDAWLDGP